MAGTQVLLQDPGVCLRPGVYSRPGV